MTNSAQFSTNVLSNNKNQLNFSLAGSRARVEESNGKLYVIIDGHRIEADKNDLFGMNKSNPNEWLEKLVAEYDKEMQNNEEKIGFLEKQEEAIKSAIKKVKNAFWSLLSKCGVRSINQITDEADRSRAISLNNQKWDLSFTKTGINNQIHSALTDNFLAACNRGKYSNELAFNKAMYA